MKNLYYLFILSFLLISCIEGESEKEPNKLDSDSDGVSDDIDICSNTPEGETVNLEGCSEFQTLKVGDYFQGGTIFWLNEDFNSDLKGLIISHKDIEPFKSNGTDFGCIGEYLGATGIKIGDGENNTKIILEKCNDDNCAARLVNLFSDNNFTDWYLPSQLELLEIYNNLNFIEGAILNNGGFSFEKGIYATYGTSTEIDKNKYVSIGFDGVLKGQVIQDDKDGTRKIRAIRRIN